MKKNFLSIAILAILLAFSCDDNPSKIENNTVPSSSVITFTPDTLYISDDANNNTVRFEGVDFIKNKPDSVRFNDFKVDIIKNDNEQLTVNIPFKYIGKYSVNMFFPSGLITLDKKILIINNSNQEPTAENIYFEPDTLIIISEDSQNYIILKGMNFNSKVDSVLIGEKKCIISGDKSPLGYRIIDSITVNLPGWIFGNFEVIVFIRGKKIILPKKLVVLKRNFEIDFTQLNKITWEFRKILSFQEHITSSFDPHSGSDKTEKTFETTQYYFVRSKSTEDLLIVFNPPSLFYSTTFQYMSPIGFSYEMDSQKGYIKNFNVNMQLEYSETDNAHGGFNLKNVPYTINFLQDNKVELEIKLSGKNIDNYYPYFYYSKTYRSIGGKYSYSFNTIPKKDPATGKDINYFPATDSSLIVIHLRNF